MKNLPLFLAGMLLLQSGACQKQKPDVGNSSTVAQAPSGAAGPSGAALVTQAATVIGENYCLGCKLKKERGAAAQCSLYGHRHALQVESATAEGGQSLPQLAGETLHYLDNDQSAALLKGEELHNKQVEVKGKLFAPERTIQVAEVRAL